MVNPHAHVEHSLKLPPAHAADAGEFVVEASDAERAQGQTARGFTGTVTRCTTTTTCC